jgi:hypothetical protein
MLRFRVASRAEFERLLAQPPERLTDLQRAVRFLYVQRLAFGGRVSGRTSVSMRPRPRASTWASSNRCWPRSTSACNPW